MYITTGSFPSNDFILCEFGPSRVPWRIGDAIEGVQIIGATGSGKTSGSGATLARAFLERARGFMGGLVLTAKHGETDLWRRYATETGRSDDLIIFSPRSGHRFNFLEYELQRSEEQGGGLTQNLVSLFLNGLTAGDSVVSSSDPYWNDALRELLTHVVDLVVMGSRSTGTADRPSLALADIVRTVRTAPQRTAEVGSRQWRADSWCWQHIERAIGRAKEKRLHPVPAQNAAREADLQQTVEYWLNDFPRLSERTRSIVVSSLTSKLAGLLRSPLREVFSSPRGISDEVRPEATFAGKIIVLDFPVKDFGEVGRFAQVLYKTIWQRAVEQRRDTSRVVFLWADESQYFVTGEDMQFQQTARSQRAATVYLTQNLPNYYAMIGGRNPKAAADSLLGNLATKILHANADPTTNEWAQRLVGVRSETKLSFSSGTQDGQTTVSRGEHQALKVQTLLSLPTGRGADGAIGAVIVRSGPEWSGGTNAYVIHRFTRAGVSPATGQ
ncbi:MAG: type IV secretory system conjugative DNA transfer family protein [Phycisphaerales bacterium]